MIKKLIMISAVIVATTFGLVGSPASAAVASPPQRNYGTFRIQVDLGNDQEPPSVPAIIDPAFAATTQKFTLSDSAHQGTFSAHFRITALDTPAYDTFMVRNNTALPMVFGYVYEDQHILPANPHRDMTELQACFNALCDAGVFFPANTLSPPVPLGVIPPNTTTEFKVGMKLSPFAHAYNWDGTSLTTTLYFDALPSL